MAASVETRPHIMTSQLLPFQPLIGGGLKGIFSFLSARPLQNHRSHLLFLHGPCNNWRLIIPAIRGSVADINVLECQSLFQFRGPSKKNWWLHTKQGGLRASRHGCTAQLGVRREEADEVEVEEGVASCLR